jgi:hypothetical protein
MGSTTAERCDEGTRVLAEVPPLLNPLLVSSSSVVVVVVTLPPPLLLL